MIAPGRASDRDHAACAASRSAVGVWLLIAGAMLAFALVAVWPGQVQADQSSQRTRQYVGGRLDASYANTCAIAADGSARCWGAGVVNGYGNTKDIGDDETPGSVGPIDLGSGRTAKQISVGESHVCAILDNGSVRCWGYGIFGQLGYANTKDIGDDETPGSVGPIDLGAGRTAVAISAGSQHTCAILDNGTVRCWGRGESGQLGYGNKNDIGDNETPGSVGPVDLGAGRTAVAISAGSLSTCALLDNGTVRCWGSNNGQLGIAGGSNIGDNETPGSVGPIDLGAGRTAVAISAGEKHTCAILDNGGVKCWGSGEGGQLGYGNTKNVTLPSTVGTVDLGAGRTAISIAAASEHTCAVLDNGFVRCWGNGSWGKLGYGNTEYAKEQPIGDNETPGSVEPVDVGKGRTGVSITTGTLHSCALLDDGTVSCWGEVSWGKLGYATGVKTFETPTKFWAVGDDETPGSMGPVDVGKGHGVLEVVTGNSHSCARFDVGTAYCWGNGANGRLGSGSTDNIGDDESPGAGGPIALGGRNAIELSAGGSHTCALLDNGAVRCWGLNSSGQLGLANTESIGDNETPGAVGSVDLGSGRNAIAIATGANHTCALRDDGAVLCWGLNVNGQLGYGNTTTIGDNETPGSVGPVALGHSAVAITASGNHTCARLDDGTLRCWGAGGGGQLGYGNTKDIGDDEFPTSTGTVSIGGSALGIAAGGTHSCAALSTGALRCWGRALEGQLGYGNTITIGDNELPSTVGAVEVGAGRSVTAITAGESHTCAILDSGALRCWGLNSSGQLGYANTTTIGDTELPSAAGPVNLGSGRNARDVSAGGSHTCAVLDNGTVLCWGLNTSGQLGTRSKTTIGDNETPGSVGALDFVDILPMAVNDSPAVNEDVATPLDVLANDTDPDNGPKKIASKTDGSQGTVAITGGGTGLTYTPKANYCGSDSFTYELNGGSKATVSVTVTCVDDSPVAVNDSATLTEDAGATAVAVLTNDTDIDAGPKTINSKTNGSHGAVAITGGGTGLTYIPDPNYCGPDSFTYTLNGGSMATVSITVTCVDDSPVAVDDSVALVEDAAATAVAVLANDGDVDGGATITIASKTNGAHGTVAITGGGTGLTYTPDPNYCGPDSFAYELNGGSTAAVSVTVSCVDDPPIAVSDSSAVGEDSGANAIDVLTNDTDIDAGPKTIVGKTNGSHGAVAITGGGTGLTYIPDPNYCGPDSFTYELNGGSIGTVSVTVSCVDDAPTAVNDSTTLIEDASATAVDVLVNDTDVDGGPKSIVSKSNGAHGTVTVTGGGTGVTYSPTSNYYGPDSFAYELNGGSKAIVSITLTCVDDPPMAVNDSTTMGEDAPVTAIDVLPNDTDVDAGPKSINSAVNGVHGSVAIIGGGAGLTYTPDPNYCGPDSFAYELNGGSKAIVSITLTCVDDSPVAVNDSTTLGEDSSATAIDVLSNDTDIDDGPKSIASRTNGSHGTVAITGGGTGLTYTPDPNYCGPDSFAYELNGGSIGTVSVTVTCVDDPPVAVGDAATIGEDSPPTAIDVLTNDTDVDGGPKKVESKTDGAHGTVVITGGGTSLTYVPAANYCGPDSFTYTLNGGSSATVAVTVLCDNDPPVAVDDSAGFAEDASATAIDVLSNDTDLDGGLKVIQSKTNGAHGSVVVAGDGSGLTYAPDPNYCGADSFTYTLNGGSTATVSIAIACADDAPSAIDDSATVSEDSGQNVIGVLSNDPDVDGGTKTIASKTDGVHGTVSITGGGSGLTYAPAANFCGADFFTYTLNGGSQATVSVTVSCVDDAPTAVSDSDTVIEDAPAQAIDVLANDTDIDGGPKTIAGKANGSHGAVAIIGAGAGLTYTPDPNYCGPDSFTYTLNGGSQATVSITVTCVEDPPPPGGEGGGSQGDQGGSVQNVFPPGSSSGPVVNVTPGVGVVSGRRHPRIAIKGVYAFFTLTCKFKDKDCIGTVAITATIPSIALGPTQDDVPLVKGKFRIGAGRSVLVRAKLTKAGLKVLETKKTLRGIASRMTIVDADNSERGEIEVNLVRRPKASLLPGATK